jgi:hypothetical protein
MDSNPVTPQNEVGEPNLQNLNAACMDQLRSVKTRVGIDSGGEDSDSSSGPKNALYYLERLRVLQEQAGHDPSAVLLDSKQQVSHDKDDNVMNDENLNKKSVLDDRPEGVSFFVFVQHTDLSELTELSTYREFPILIFLWWTVDFNTKLREGNLKWVELSAQLMRLGLH